MMRSQTQSKSTATEAIVYCSVFTSVSFQAGSGNVLVNKSSFNRSSVTLPQSVGQRPKSDNKTTVCQLVWLNGQNIDDKQILFGWIDLLKCLIRDLWWISGLLVKGRWFQVSLIIGISMVEGESNRSQILSSLNRYILK